MAEGTSAPVIDDTNESKEKSKKSTKRADKLQRKEEEKKKKQAEAAEVEAAAGPAKPKVAVEEELDPTQYRNNRLKALEMAKTAGLPTYPHKFDVSLSIPEYIAKYAHLQTGDLLEDDFVTLAGRIMTVRSSSSSLLFFLFAW